LKLEDGEEGVNWILDKSGMGIHLKWSNERINPSNKSSSLYRQLSCDTLEALYYLYQADFVLFNYSATQYLNQQQIVCSFMKPTWP